MIMDWEKPSTYSIYIYIYVPLQTSYNNMPINQRNSMPGGSLWAPVPVCYRQPRWYMSKFLCCCWPYMLITAIAPSQKVEVKPMASRPACSGIRPPSGTREQLCVHVQGTYFQPCGFLLVGRPPWREGGSVMYPYNCYWALPQAS
jgi:hypothetical protein